MYTLTHTVWMSGDNTEWHQATENTDFTHISDMHTSSELENRLVLVFFCGQDINK